MNKRINIEAKINVHYKVQAETKEQKKQFENYTQPQDFCNRMQKNKANTSTGIGLLLKADGMYTDNERIKTFITQASMVFDQV